MDSVAARFRGKSKRSDQQAFTFRRASPNQTCPVTPLSIPQTVNGALSSTDCNNITTGRYFDLYSFAATAGQQIALSLSSAQFDTYLVLFDANDNLIAEDDDGGGGTNSRIPPETGYLTLPANGTYFIAVSSYDAGAFGSYSLNLMSTTSSTVTLLNHRITGGPFPSDCTPPPAKTAFASTDESAYQWVHVSGARSTDSARWDFYQPNGSLYAQTQPQPMNYNGEVCFWGGIYIAGQNAANLPGTWQVRCYYNNVLLVTDTFTISGSPTPTPTATPTPTLTPTPTPTPGQCITPPTGLVAWWPGDGNANDIQGTYNGTLQGGVSFTTAKVGQGFTFSSDTDRVIAPHNANLNAQTPGFTADFWMRGVKNQPQSLAVVFEKSHGFIDSTGWFFQCESATGKISFGIGAGGSGISNFPFIASNTDVLDGNFHLVAGTWDGSMLRLYVDGTLQGSQALTTPANNTRPVNIGFAAGGGTPQRFFRGVVDEAEVFNRALSSTEIQAIVSAGSAGKCKTTPGNCVTAPSGAVAWLPGDGQASDLTGTHNGTLKNGALATATGKVGQAFSFDGENDYVDMGAWSAGTQWTLEAWVNPASVPTNRRAILGGMNDCNDWALAMQDGKWGVAIKPSSGACTETVSSNVAAVAGTWYHLAATSDGTTARIYVNGELKGSGTVATGATGTTAGAWIGGNVCCTEFFPGLVDEATIYNRALSLAEIQAIYNVGSAGKCKTTPGNCPTNLLRNPGAEEGAGDSTVIPGWTTTSNFSAVKYAGDVPVSESQRINGGNNYFAGGPDTALSTATQVVNVSSRAGEIDTGQMTAQLQAHLAGYSNQGDNASVKAEFLNSSSTALSSLSVGPVAGTNSMFQLKTASGPVPAGTRSIRVTLTAVRTDGSYNDAYFDNLFLGLCQGGSMGFTWTPTSGPTGTQVWNLFNFSSNIFAGTNNGVFRTNNDGATWTAINTGLPDRLIYGGFVALGTNLFVGTEKSVSRSTDLGNTWTSVSNGLPLNTTGNAVTALAVNGTSLFAGIYWDRVYRSNDNGASWTAVNTGLPNTNPTALLVSGGSVYLGTGTASLFRSDNNGASWAAARTGIPDVAVMALAANGANLFAGTDNEGRPEVTGGVYLSTNQGQSWTAVNTGLTNQRIRALWVSGNNLFAGTLGGGVFVSNNNGQSWTAINEGLTNLRVSSLVGNETKLFAGTYESGVFVTSLTTQPACPTITGITPLSGTVGSTVTITGTNFTGVTAVRFANNISAQFTVNGATQITATVPSGAVTGAITLSKPNCADVQTPTFTVTTPPQCPTVTNLNPSSGAVGSTVTITGTNFTGVTSVKFANNITAQFTINSATQITATVPSGAATGPITLNKPNCTDVQTQPFTITTPQCIDVAISTGLTASTGTTLTVPLTVSDTTGKGVIAYDATITFDPAVLRLQSTPTDKTGTLSSNFTITTNSPTSGQLRISGFGSTALGGAGTLFNLKFDVLGAAQACSNLNFTSFRFNEGTPCATTANGRACVTGGGTISGAVSYCVTPKPVPSVIINVTGSSTTSATTNSSGNYTLPYLNSGNYTLTPAKTGDTNGIASFDAALVAQHVVGIITLTSCQQSAGDTSNNGELSSFDAALIAQFVVGINNAASIAGTWKFAPPTRSYTNLSNDQTNQNFDAVLVGDVSGNWTPTNLLPEAELFTPATAPDQAVQVSLSELTAATGASLIIPITVSDLSGRGVIAYDFDLTYDAGVLQAQLDPTEAGGTLSSAFTITANPTPGRLRVSGFGTQSLAGSGVLLKLRFNVIGNAGASTALTWQKFQFNEGTPQASLVNGRVVVFNIPTLSFNPLAQTIAVGSTGSLTLIASVAPTSALTLNLTSANPTIASVPATATIPAGQTMTTFNVMANAVGGPVTITAAHASAPSTPLATASVTVVRPVACVSAASFTGDRLASEAIVAAFGTSLATATVVADTVPLPTSLAGTTVRVRDSAGVERLAPLFFVSTGQVNYLMPPGTANGLTTVTVTSGDGTVSTGRMTIASVAPGLFAANANGQGAPAAVLLRVKADGSQSYENVAQWDSTSNRFVPAPIELGPAGDQVFLIAFGTGWRNHSALTAVSALIGGVSAEVQFAGAQGDLAGLDQLNLLLPRSLAGRGEVDLALTVDGQVANTLRIRFR